MSESRGGSHETKSIFRICARRYSTHMARLDCKSGDFDSCLIHDFFFGAKVTVARLDQLDTQLGTTRKVDYIFRS